MGFGLRGLGLGFIGFSDHSCQSDVRISAVDGRNLSLDSPVASAMLALPGLGLKLFEMAVIFAYMSA